ncbi:MAG: NYN domain-containing protein [Polyangiaceae bacterium]|nr:NYN domain-containing protein [Polyangiaceae bacterium]
MIFLIDGYNFLHAILLNGLRKKTMPRALSHQSSRAAPELRWWTLPYQKLVLDHLSPLPWQGKLIFDAQRDNSERLRVHSLLHSPEIIYALSADDYCVHFARDHQNQDITIVSADRALQDRAARYGARRVTPWGFDELLTEERGKTPQLLQPEFRESQY